MANTVMYGFETLNDIFDKRVTEVGVEVVNDAIQRTIDEHNRQLSTLTSLFATPTSEFKTVYKTGAAARLQPLDNSGRALPIKGGGQYAVSYPLHTAGTAWGTNYISSVKMTVEEANNITATLIGADINWMRDHILAALFYDGAAGGGWTFNDPEHDSLSIMGLADGDTTTYQIKTGAGSAATDDHYLAQAAAIGDAANPYPTIYTELTEHPENSGDVIALIPTASKDTTMALANFRPLGDPNVQLGANTAQLVGNLNVATPGTLIGYVDKVWIYEWPVLPTGYIISTCTGGNRALRMRQEPEAQLQGFKKVAERNDHPFMESQYLRIAGFGAWNRVGAVVYRIGNASYAIPTGYDSPMA